MRTDGAPSAEAVASATTSVSSEARTCPSGSDEYSLFIYAERRLLLYLQPMAMTKTIELRTEVPGPKSREIIERKEQVIAATLSLVHPIVTAEGRGATLTDVDGNTVIAFEGAFHGRTMLSMTMTSKTHPYKAGLGPFAPEVYRVPYPHEYRGIDVESALKSLRRAFVTQVPAESVAAIVMEPVLGEGGFVVAPTEFVRGVRDICDEHGIVFVVDEVQTGFGRTGRMWGIEHHDVEPDLMTIAKSIAGGLPLSAVIGKAEIMDAPPDSAIGGTYVGNPVAQAAALAVLDVIAEEGLCDRAAAIGETVRGRMEAWQERFDAIGDVRGLGAMLAIELVADRETKEPAPDLATAVTEAAASNGLLLLKSGIYSNCIRVLAPLVLSDAEVDEALAAWEAALETTLG